MQNFKNLLGSPLPLATMWRGSRDLLLGFHLRHASQSHLYSLVGACSFELATCLYQNSFLSCGAHPFNGIHLTENSNGSFSLQSYGWYPFDSQPQEFPMEMVVHQGHQGAQWWSLDLECIHISVILILLPRHLNGSLLSSVFIRFLPYSPIIYLRSYPCLSF